MGNRAALPVAPAPAPETVPVEEPNEHVKQVLALRDEMKEHQVHLSSPLVGGATSKCKLCHDHGGSDVVLPTHTFLQLQNEDTLEGGGGWRSCQSCLANTRTIEDAQQLHHLLAAHEHGHSKALQAHIRAIMNGTSRLEGGGCAACKSIRMSKRSAHAFHTLFHPSS